MNNYAPPFGVDQFPGSVPGAVLRDGGAPSAAPGPGPFCVLGIDPSLTGTGLVVVDQAGTMLHRQVLRTKPGPMLPRLATILPAITGAYKTYRPALVVIEGLVQDKFNSGNDRAGLHWLIRWKLAAEDHLQVVFPSTLKKWVCGTGKAEKQLMLMKVLKRWGLEFTDDNEADAYCLARWGLAYLAGEVAPLPVKTKKRKKAA